MEEDEDKVLLSTLGITSANPEDIERDILAEVRDNAENDGEAGGSTVVLPDKSKNIDPSSTNQTKLYNRLRAVKFEIDAVASTFEQVRNVASSEDHDDDDKAECGDRKDDVLVSPNDFTLQRALAADRLKSLKRTKVQIEKELSNLHEDDTTKGVDYENLLADMVREETRRNRNVKEVQKPGKKRKGVRERFHLMMIQTLMQCWMQLLLDLLKQDELVRKGILTPFHKLKGFERGLQQPGPSSGCKVSEEEERSDDIASDSIARASQSMREAMKARPMTKMLDLDSLPKLEAPTHPFQRLKTPLQVPPSPESDAEKGKGAKRKKNVLCQARNGANEFHMGKPLGRKWCGSVTSSYEEEKLEDGEDNGDSSFVTLEGGLKIPEAIFNELFEYQKVGVQWLWELHCQRAGGIIGDEMGLGKTIQVLSFLGALHFSNMYKPSIVVCPVTLLRQWKREAQKWYPRFHVELLHDSAQDLAHRKKQAKSYDSDNESEVFEAEFAVPISVGGYANASPLQVSTAYRCAVVLRDLIMPYLLRRMKVDVDAQLPKKTEHVLFCSLTAEQRSVYRAFLASTEVEQILDGNRNSYME
ncbi:hypothetical protein GH714_027177 [Hevea brasiliensis]|uniref:Helicase ATP-binding domain-containing protein n=1 Tax=Hevea brasiliensis TaxID=3981 RepID=A0A6A6KVV7_HEVBR|nr:hypothetical protein GH714_027177 [Hevea brasiliensis]